MDIGKIKPPVFISTFHTNIQLSFLNKCSLDCFKLLKELILTIFVNGLIVFMGERLFRGSNSIIFTEVQPRLILNQCFFALFDPFKFLAALLLLLSIPVSSFPTFKQNIFFSYLGSLNYSFTPTVIGFTQGFYPLSPKLSQQCPNWSLTACLTLFEYIHNPTVRLVILKDKSDCVFHRLRSSKDPHHLKDKVQSLSCQGIQGSLDLTLNFHSVLAALTPVIYKYEISYKFYTLFLVFLPLAFLENSFIHSIHIF